MSNLSTQPARAAVASYADTPFARGVGTAAAAAAARTQAVLQNSPGCCRRTSARAASFVAVALSALLFFLRASGQPPPITLPPPVTTSLPGPYIMHARPPPPPASTPTPPLPGLAFALAPRANHSDDAALSTLSAPSRSAAYWGEDAAANDPHTFILSSYLPPPTKESVGARVVRAAVLARRRNSHSEPVAPAWLAGPPSVVWLPPAVARALAGGAGAATAPDAAPGPIAWLADARLGVPGGIILTDAALSTLEGPAGRAEWAACLNGTAASGREQGEDGTDGPVDPAAACLAKAGLTLLDARYGVPAEEVDARVAAAPQPGDGGVAQLLADALLAAAGACGSGSRCRAGVDRTVAAVLTRLGAEQPPVPGVSPIEAEAPPAAAPSAAATARLVVAALTRPAGALRGGGAAAAAGGASPMDAALLAAAATVRAAVSTHCPPVDLMPPVAGEGGNGGGEGAGDGQGAAVAAREAAADSVSTADAASASTGGVCAYSGFEARRAVGEASGEAVGRLLRAVVAANG